MEKKSRFGAVRKLLGHLTGSNVRILTVEAKRKARVLGKLRATKKPWYKTKKRHAKTIGKKVEKAKGVVTGLRKDIKKAISKRRLARGGVGIGLAATPALMKKEEEYNSSDQGSWKYSSSKLAFNPMSATKSVMKSFGTAPKPAAGVAVTATPMLPITSPSAKTLKIRTPTASKPMIPKPPMPKPPNVTTGGLLRPGKNVVS